MFITEKLLRLSDPSLMEGGDQDGRTGLPGASCRPYLPLCGPRGCSCRAPRPWEFSRGPLCRGPLCRGCCVLFQGGFPTQGPPQQWLLCPLPGGFPTQMPPLQGLLCPLPGGLPDPGAEPSSPTAPALRGNYPEPPGSPWTPPLRLQVQTNIKNKFENKTFTKLVENRTRSK